MRFFFCLLPICFNSWENRMQCWYGRLFFTINCISLSMNSFISSVQLQILYIFIYVQWTNKLTHRLRCLSTWRWSTKGRYEDRAVISSNITPSSPFKSVKKNNVSVQPLFPLSYVMAIQPYFNPIRRNMKDNLNSFENGRQPQIFENGRRPKCFGKWKMTLIFSNRRWTQHSFVWKTTYIFL